MTTERHLLIENGLMYQTHVLKGKCVCFTVISTWQMSMAEKFLTSLIVIKYDNLCKERIQSQFRGYSSMSEILILIYRLQVLRICQILKCFC